MNRHRLIAASFLAVTCLASAGKVYASPAGFRAPVHAMFGKPKMIKLDVRNESGAPIELRMGDSVVTLPSGKTQSFKLAAGTRITANATSKTYAAGTLLAEMSNSIDGSTIVLH